MSYQGSQKKIDAPENGHILPSFNPMISPCFMIFHTHVNDSMMVMDHVHRFSPGLPLPFGNVFPFWVIPIGFRLLEMVAVHSYVQ